MIRHYLELYKAWPGYEEEQVKITAAKPAGISIRRKYDEGHNITEIFLCRPYLNSNTIAHEATHNTFRIIDQYTESKGITDPGEWEETFARELGQLTGAIHYCLGWYIKEGNRGPAIMDKPHKRSLRAGPDGIPSGNVIQDNPLGVWASGQ